MVSAEPHAAKLGSPGRRISMTRDLQCRITNKDLSLICVDAKINGRKPVGLIKAVKEKAEEGGDVC